MLNKFTLIIFVILLHLVDLQANIEDDVEKLKNDFYFKVVTLNTYKQRYEHYYTKMCGDNDYKCDYNLTKRVMSWESTQSDKILSDLIDKNDAQRLITDDYMELVKRDLYLKMSSKLDNMPQFVSFVDLEKQIYILMFFDNLQDDFYYVGAAFISSGNPDYEIYVKKGDDHYFETPAGLFKNQLGWRSNGLNHDGNVSYSYGRNDRFVYYFGRINSIRYDIKDTNGTTNPDKSTWKLIYNNKLNFAIHAKEPSPLGRPVSHGCVRMSNELNIFLDNYNVMHKSRFNYGVWTPKTKLKKPLDSLYDNYAGEYLLIVDKIRL